MSKRILSEKEAKLFAMSDWFGLSQSEIAIAFGVAEKSVPVMLSKARKKRYEATADLHGEALEAVQTTIAQEIEAAYDGLDTRMVRAQVWEDDSFKGIDGTPYDGVKGWMNTVATRLDEDAIIEHLSDTKYYTKADLQQLLGVLMVQRLRDANYDVFTPQGLRFLAEKLPDMLDEDREIPYDWHVLRDWICGYVPMQTEVFDALMYMTNPAREEMGRSPAGIAMDALYEAASSNYQGRWRERVTQVMDRLCEQGVIEKTTIGRGQGLMSMVRLLQSKYPQFSEGKWRLFLRGEYVAGKGEESIWHVFAGELKQLGIDDELCDEMYHCAQELTGLQTDGAKGVSRRAHRKYEDELSQSARARFQAATVGRPRGKALTYQDVADATGLNTTHVNNRLNGDARMEEAFVQTLDELLAQHLPTCDCQPSLKALYDVQHSRAEEAPNASTGIAEQLRQQERDAMPDLHEAPWSARDDATLIVLARNAMAADRRSLVMGDTRAQIAKWLKRTDSSVDQRLRLLRRDYGTFLEGYKTSLDDRASAIRTEIAQGIGDLDMTKLAESELARLEEKAAPDTLTQPDGRERSHIKAPDGKVLGG